MQNKRMSMERIIHGREKQVSQNKSKSTSWRQGVHLIVLFSIVLSVSLILKVQVADKWLNTQ